MSSRLGMLQMVRLAPSVLGPASEQIVAFVASQVLPSGGVCDRSGRADLWYAAFAFDVLVALDALPTDGAQPAWLSTFGDGAALDVVHAACLARCWAAYGGAPAVIRAGLVTRLQREPEPSVYRAFLLRGALQDLGVVQPPDTAFVQWLHRHRREDGAFADDEVATAAVTPVTAAAVVLLREHGAPMPTQTRTWLRQRLHADGGFVASPDVPMPDLLSTAVALHALDRLHQPIPPSVRERCLDYLDTLWTGRSFCATWADDEIDTEYAFYGLLALGHLV